MCLQDLVYTRVFCMIVVRERVNTDRKPFNCVAFVCESRQAARNLTYALATAFQVKIFFTNVHCKISQQYT